MISKRDEAGRQPLMGTIDSLSQARRSGETSKQDPFKKGVVKMTKQELFVDFILKPKEETYV
jgi:hypothetical protein